MLSYVNLFEFIGVAIIFVTLDIHVAVHELIFV